MAGMRRLLVVVLLLAGCGGGGGGGGAADGGEAAGTTAATVATPTDVQTVTVPDTARVDPTSDGDPTFTVELDPEDETATAGRPWRFTVRAVDSAGAPASATAKMRVFVGDELVDTLGWFPFEGTLTRTHTWPRALIGKDVVLQAEVEGPGGTQRENADVRIG
jgi:hypothetical protein